MSSYHGGKQKVGAQIAQRIHEHVKDIEEKHNTKFKGYIEPFTGMCGVYRHIPELLGNDIEYIAGDYNESVIEMWKATQKGWKPPESCTKIKWQQAKANTKPSAERGFLGHQYSYGGQYFKRFAGNYGKNTSQPAAAQRVVDIAHVLKDVHFTSGSYTQFMNHEGYIIYCDPPYSKRNEYFEENGDKIHFDSEAFWWAVRVWSYYGNIVFVSEYEAPEDFVLLDEHTHHVFYAGRTDQDQNNERLFIHKSWV